MTKMPPPLEELAKTLEGVFDLPKSPRLGKDFTGWTGHQLLAEQGRIIRAYQDLVLERSYAVSSYKQEQRVFPPSDLNPEQLVEAIFRNRERLRKWQKIQGAMDALSWALPTEWSDTSEERKKAIRNEIDALNCAIGPRSKRLYLGQILPWRKRKIAALTEELSIFQSFDWPTLSNYLPESLKQGIHHFRGAPMWLYAKACGAIDAIEAYTWRVGQAPLLELDPEVITDLHIKACRTQFQPLMEARREVLEKRVAFSASDRRDLDLLTDPEQSEWVLASATKAIEEGLLERSSKEYQQYCEVLPEVLQTEIRADAAVLRLSPAQQIKELCKILNDAPLMTRERVALSEEYARANAVLDDILASSGLSDYDLGAVQRTSADTKHTLTQAIKPRKDPREYYKMEGSKNENGPILRLMPLSTMNLFLESEDVHSALGDQAYVLELFDAFHKDVVWDYILNTLPGQTQTLAAMEKALEFPEVRYAPYLIMNFWREKGLDNDSHFLTSYGSPGESGSLATKYFDALTDEQLAEMEALNIPGLMKVVECARADKTYARSHFIGKLDEQGFNEQIPNPANDTIEDGLADMALHFLENGTDSEKYFAAKVLFDLHVFTSYNTTTERRAERHNELLDEFAGAMGNACYLRGEQGFIAKRPYMVNIRILDGYSEDPEEGEYASLEGNCLWIRADVLEKNEQGIEVVVPHVIMRGDNPKLKGLSIQNYVEEMEDYFEEQFASVLQEEGYTGKFYITRPKDAQSNLATTNDAGLFRVVQPSFRDKPTVHLVEDLHFNYGLQDKCAVVREGYV